MRDRIDLWIEMPRVAPAALVAQDRAGGKRGGRARGSPTPGLWPWHGPRRMLNGRLTGRALRAVCRLDPDAEARIIALAELERASGRGTERLLRVARTIADLAGDPASSRPDHLDEAAWFRAGDLRLAAREAG